MLIDNYTGNKKIEGLYQWIINHIPKHKAYYEPFAGSAAIAFLLPDRPHKVISDCNRSTTDQLTCRIQGRSGIEVINCNAFSLIEDIQSKLYGPEATVKNDFMDPTDIFVYMDPPYRIGSRHSKKELYEYELTDADHLRLVAMVSGKAKYNCMISHYRDPLYDSLVDQHGWIRIEKKVRYHTRTVTECLYMNYELGELQTYQYLGKDCWDRQRIKRKLDKIEAKLLKLPLHERLAVIDRIAAVKKK